GETGGRGRLFGGAEEAPEVPPLPPRGPAVEAELLLLLAEADGVDLAPAVGESPDAEGGVEHLVVDDRVEEEPRHPRAIEGGVDADDAVVRVVASEIDRIAPRARAAPAPGDRDLEPRLEVARVQSIVRLLQVEVEAPVREVHVRPAAGPSPHQVAV